MRLTGSGKRRGVWALRAWLVVAAAAAPAARGQGTYPAAPQVSKGGLRLQLQDYAEVPKSGAGATAQVARINFLRPEPATAPLASTRFFANDLNGNLYVLDKLTRSFDSNPLTPGVVEPYLNFPSHFTQFDPTPGYAAGVVTFAFDPEYGLGTAATHPNYGKFYTTHTEIDPNLNPNEYRVAVLTEWKDSNVADATFTGGRREMLRVTYTDNIHPIGDLAFNPNAAPGHPDYRMLYLASGDGGAGERSDANRNNPQMLNNLAGKVLRIQPDDPAGAAAYTIPADNPFASTPNARGEVWAFGLRNPHRLAWDAASGMLIVNDIGLHSYEEVNLVKKGANYGYSRIEGTQVLGTNNQVTGGALPATLPLITNDPASPIGTIAPTYPVAQYSHRDGDAVSSGFVYRGTRVPELIGKYVFGDITTGRLFYADYTEMLAADDGDPFTTAKVEEFQIEYEGLDVRLFDVVRNRFDLRNDGLDDNDGLPGGAEVTNGLDPYGVPYGGGRADVRLALDADGELYLLSKSDGMIRAVVPEPGGALGMVTLAGAAALRRRRRRQAW